MGRSILGGPMMMMLMMLVYSCICLCDHKLIFRSFIQQDLFVGFKHSFFVHPIYRNSFEDYDQEKKKIPKGTTTQSSSIIKAILF